MRSARTIMAAIGSSVCVMALAVPSVARAGVESASPAGQTAPRTAAEAGPPSWPRSPEAPKGAPNILLIMTDDVGFGTSSAFGGPVPTPVFDALAKKGLRYNQFNTTALCSPTRAALLTGRDSHRVGMGQVTNLPTGYEGYTSVIPKSAGTVAEILKQNGYNTAMFGKAHVTPEWEMSAAGPFDRWPTGLGFEYFYGFLSADTNLKAPNLYENTLPVAPSRDPSYHLESDMADRTVHWLNMQRAVAPDKPFFIYYAPGTAHTPHQAPPEWLARFRGKFDQGWDAIREETFARQKKLGVIPRDARLTERPAGIPAWSSLTADQKRLSTRLMEAYAASLAYCDEQIGRVIENLRQANELDNTMIIFIQGDNGGSAEGGLNGMLYEQSMITGGKEELDYQLAHIDDIGTDRAYNHIPVGWGWALNAPFPWYKQVASHFGGTRNGLVISWPSQIKDSGAVRSQFHYVTDIAPTILDAAKVQAPKILNGVTQSAFDGTSLSYSFANPGSPSTRTTQVFEVFENFGIYHNGWTAGVLPQDYPWTPIKDRKRTPVERREWTLFNITRDFSQSTDLAKSNPAKLKELQDLFWKEAERNKILPIHGAAEGREGMPNMTAGRTRFAYLPGITRVPEGAAPHTLGRSFRIDAAVTMPATGRGVLVTQGGRFGGYAFYLKDGRPMFHYNAVGAAQFRIAATQAIAPGEHQLSAEFVIDEPKPGSPGTLILSVDGVEVAKGRIERTLSGWLSHTEGFDVGEDTITPVNDDYTIDDSRFSGELRSLTVDLR